MLWVVGDVDERKPTQKQAEWDTVAQSYWLTSDLVQGSECTPALGCRLLRAGPCEAPLPCRIPVMPKSTPQTHSIRHVHYQHHLHSLLTLHHGTLLPLTWQRLRIAIAAPVSPKSPPRPLLTDRSTAHVPIIGAVTKNQSFCKSQNSPNLASISYSFLSFSKPPFPYNPTASPA